MAAATAFLLRLADQPGALSNGFAVSGITARHIVRLTAIASAVLLACNSASRTEEKTIPPCHEDAMIVFDASGSMSGNETLGIPNSRARIDEARSALAQVLPNATKFRRVGLVTYGPGPYNQCNVKLEFKPTPDAAGPIMSTVNAIVPAGKTPLTSGIEAAAEALDFRTKPGVVVVITDGEETCGRSPCDLAKQLRAAGYKLTIHVVAFRYDSFSWTGGGNSVMDLMCVVDQNGGLYVRANSEQELVEALEKTLDCPMISQAPLSFTAMSSNAE
jgi:Ca-activated chloride channel family protein